MTTNNVSTTIFVFALGMTIGAVAGVLLAPAAGSDLRNDMARAAGDGISQIRRQGKAVGKKANRLADSAKEQITDALEAGDDAYTQAKKAGA